MVPPPGRPTATLVLLNLLLGASTPLTRSPGAAAPATASPAAAAAIAALKLDGDGKSDASSVRTLDSRPPLDLSKDKVAEKPSDDA